MSKELEKVKVLEVKEVAFNGVKLLAVKTDKGIFTSISAFCDDLGLASNKQIDKIKKNQVLEQGYTVLVLPSNGGNQSVGCIDIDFLPLWLTQISVKHCKIEIQPLLLEFQLKSQKVLAAAFIQKEETKEPLKVFTASELILQQAQVLVNLEKTQLELINKTNNLENKIIQFERKQIEATKKLFEPELPATVIEYQKDDRAKINELVKNYANASGNAYQDVWNKLYVEFVYRKHVDLKARAKNRKITPLQVAENDFLLNDLYNLAIQLFHPKYVGQIVNIKEG